MSLDHEAGETADGQDPLCVCARLLNPLDAQVLTACLQSQGIAAHTMDSDVIYANGALFAALPLGGVRVMVPRSQLAEALRIHAAFEAGEYAIDEDFDVGPPAGAG